MSAQVRLAPRAKHWQAFGAALSLEVLAVGGALTWWALHPVTPPLRMLPLEIEAPAQAPAPAPLPEPTPPQPAPVQQRLRVPTAVAAAPTPVAPAPMPTPIAPEPVAAAPSPTPAPVAAPVAAPAPPPAPPQLAAPGPSVEYIAKVRAAVQAAFVYPPAAAAVGFQGRTRVSFSLHGVAPVGARVLIGSGMAMVDRAALQSVQVASYPPPPAEMKGADASFEVWVEFKS